MVSLIKFWVVVVSLFVFIKLVFETLKKEKNLVFPQIKRWRLAITGFVSNVADTIGIGSFAVIVAFDKAWKLVDDKKLPGTLNAQSILPAMCQALFFLQVVQVEISTLVSLVVGATLGGFLGGFVVSGLNKQAIRLLMFVGYIGIALLVISSKVGLLPLGGELMELTGSSLFLGIFGMFVSGALPAIGVGAYAPTQVILFLLGMSPLAAFPIMTTSGAIQQSVAGWAFIMRGQVAFKASILIGLAGVAGVLVSAPFIAYINPETLRWLLLFVVLYNIRMLWASYRQPATAALEPQAESA